MTWQQTPTEFPQGNFKSKQYYNNKKKHICFENTSRRSPTIHIWCLINYSFEPKKRGENSCHTLEFPHLELGHGRCHDGFKKLLGKGMRQYFRDSSKQKTFFWPGDLDLWPMTLTLTYELDLDILLLDLPAKIQVRMSVRSPVKARQTHTHR